MDEVYRPDMIGVLGSQTDNRSIVMIEPLAALLPVRQLQAFLTPDPRNFLVIDRSALSPQKFADLPISVVAILNRPGIVGGSNS